MKMLLNAAILLLGVVTLANAQPTVDGQFLVMTNNGSQYSVKVQIKASAATGMGTTTLSFSFGNTTGLSFPATASLVAGTDYVINPGFAALGTYDVLTVSRPAVSRVSINISYAGANNAGFVVGTGWTDIATINFTTTNASGSSNLAWVTKQVYDDDNATQWVNGTYPNLNSSPLPVELTSFTASAHGRSVTLAWATATEIKNSGFQIERKALDAKKGEWQNVAFVNGHGTTNTPQSYGYTDALQVAGKYSYRLKQTDADGKFEYSKEVEAVIALQAQDYALSSNYPNPFNPTTSFHFAVKKAGNVSVTIFNMLGQEVRSLFNDVAQADVLYDLTFDGASLSSGTYFYVLKTADRFEVKKMLMMK